jgi:hypothetical protein
MNPSIQFKTTVPTLKHPVSPSPLRRGFFLIPLVLGCFVLSQTARAVSPAPDRGYPGNNTAEGDNALFSLTTGSNNTAIGSQALYSNTSGGDNTANGLNALRSNTTGSNNTANGAEALKNNTAGGGNTANGAGALSSNTTGLDNTANGVSALDSNTTGCNNTANGKDALFSNTTGHDNTAIGAYALHNNTTGRDNIALGPKAGSSTTGSYNIAIGHLGVAGDSSTIRIGSTHKNTYIAVIYGVPIAKGYEVVIDSSGQLGTKISSVHFKDEIKPMDTASEAIHALKPVTFRYKKELDPDRISQFGLVAEEVEKVNPDLVAHDEQGKPYTVRYEAVNAMLLNEFLKEHRVVQEQNSKIQQQEATITELKSTVAQQKKDFQATVAQLTVRLDEQASQIQKVSTQLQPSNAAPQVANNP